MAFDRSRTLRGALAGSAAAAVWYAQMPLDKRVFRSDFDDSEVLGALAGGGPALGAFLHLQNGALFGALYANVAPSLPGRPAWRGPLVGLVEHVATWPALALVSPALARNGRAFLQSAWRHVLFGLVLGELERRLNPPDDLVAPVDDAVISTNGHGSVEHVVTPL
jgi:Family of unknown function (DUF6789)